MHPNTAPFAAVSLWVCYTTAIETTLLVATPNLFAKDVLESRLRVAVSDANSRLGEKTNIAVTVDETLEMIECASARS